MTLTEESSYIPSITGTKDDRDMDQHWDINDNILPIVSLKLPIMCTTSYIQTSKDSDFFFF